MRGIASGLLGGIGRFEMSIVVCRFRMPFGSSLLIVVSSNFSQLLEDVRLRLVEVGGVQVLGDQLELRQERQRLAASRLYTWYHMYQTIFFAGLPSLSSPSRVDDARRLVAEVQRPHVGLVERQVERVDLLLGRALRERSAGARAAAARRPRGTSAGRSAMCAAMSASRWRTRTPSVDHNRGRGRIKRGRAGSGGFAGGADAHSPHPRDHFEPRRSNRNAVGAGLAGSSRSHAQPLGVGPDQRFLGLVPVAEDQPHPRLAGQLPRVRRGIRSARPGARVPSTTPAGNGLSRV